MIFGRTIAKDFRIVAPFSADSWRIFELKIYTVFLEEVFCKYSSMMKTILLSAIATSRLSFSRLSVWFFFLTIQVEQSEEFIEIHWKEFISLWNWIIALLLDGTIEIYWKLCETYESAGKFKNFRKFEYSPINPQQSIDSMGISTQLGKKRRRKSCVVIFGTVRNSG